MDKKLLDSLNNLSFALEELSLAMQNTKGDKNKSATSTAITSNKIEKKIELIDKGVKQIQSDNKKILRNQEELLKISKSQQKGSPLSDTSDPKQKNKVKDGLATIMMIAVGVLAIGLAFKLVGGINFASVIALAIALPLVALAFERISKLDLKPSQMKNVLLVTLMMAVGITASSYIFGLIQPVDIIKLITAGFIASTFVALSYSIPKILDAFKDISGTSVKKMVLFGPAVLISLSLAIALSSYILGMVKPVGIFKLITATFIAATFVGLAYSLPKLLSAFDKISPMSVGKMVLFGPVVLVALSVAIALSSYALQKVQPVGIFKLITAVFIAAAFSALGYGLGKILEGFGKMNLDPTKAAKIAIMMPIILVGLSLAIAGASLAFQLVQPVGLFKLITAALIGIVFIPLSYSLPFLAKAMSQITIKQALLMPVVLVLLATAIMATSYLFAMTQEVTFMKLINILLQAVTIAAIGFIMSFILPRVSKIPLGSLVKGSIILIGLAAVIMLSSLVLGLGSYGNYPTLNWILGVAASLAAFAFGALTIGSLVFGPQALVVAAGLVSILAISSTIAATSHILNTGKYDSYPGLFWIGGVGLSLATFSTLAVGLGVTGLLAMLGLPFMISISNTIVEISNILGSGKYDIPGFTNWALSVALLYGVFTPILLVLAPIAVANAVLSAFGANPWKMAGQMMVGIAQTMVDVSYVLSKGNYKGGPTMEWAGGVAIALGAFSPIYAMLVASKAIDWLTGGAGVGPDDFNKAIRTVVGGIKFAAEEFAGFAAMEYPKKEWAEGVGLAIGSFAPVYDILAKSKSSWTNGPTPDEFKQAIMITVGGIRDAANFFGDNIAAFDLTKVPKKEWAEGVGGAIKAFIPALDFISKNSRFWKGADTSIIEKAIRSTAMGIVNSSIILGVGKYNKVVPSDWINNTSNTIKGYIEIAGYVYSRNKWLHTALIRLGITTNDMLSTANKFKKIGERMSNVPEDWMKNVDSNVRTYVELAKYLAGSKVKMNMVSSAASGMSNLAKGYSQLASAIGKINSQLEELDVEKLNALRSLNASVVLMSLMDPDQFKSMMDQLEKRGGVLIDALQDLESKEAAGEGKKGAPTPQVKGAPGPSEPQKTISDLYFIMEAVDSKLNSISTHSDKLAKYVDEIRGDDPLIKKRNK